MGRIDAIIPDELESRLRMKIIERFGGKKGDLQIAIEDAVKLWVESDVIKELEETATSNATTSLTKDKAIDTLGKMGKVSLNALSRISHNTNCTAFSKDKALETINAILSKE